jgi:DNA helicase IV
LTNPWPVRSLKQQRINQSEYILSWKAKSKTSNKDDTTVMKTWHLRSKASEIMEQSPSKLAEAVKLLPVFGRCSVRIPAGAILTEVSMLFPIPSR